MGRTPLGCPKPLNRLRFRIHLGGYWGDIFPQGVHQNEICLLPGITGSDQNTPDLGVPEPKLLNKPRFRIQMGSGGVYPAQDQCPGTVEGAFKRRMDLIRAASVPHLVRGTQPEPNTRPPFHYQQVAIQGQVQIPPPIRTTRCVYAHLEARYLSPENGAHAFKIVQSPESPCVGVELFGRGKGWGRVRIAGRSNPPRPLQCQFQVRACSSRI